MKKRLKRGQSEQALTVRRFSNMYLEKYRRVHNRRPDFKEQALVSIREILGDIRLEDFSKSDADRFVAARSKEVRPATINRGLAVLKNMFTFAVQREYLESNPLAGFPLLPEEEPALRMMSLQEERHLVHCVAESNLVIGAYVAVLGETGLRKTEKLRMRLSHID